MTIDEQWDAVEQEPEDREPCKDVETAEEKTV